MPKNKGKGGKNRRRGALGAESGRAQRPPAGGAKAPRRGTGRGAAWRRIGSGGGGGGSARRKAETTAGLFLFVGSSPVCVHTAPLTRKHALTPYHTRAGKTESDEKRELIFKEDGQGERK